MINWYVLSGNPNAIELLRGNQGKIYWSGLSSNPNAIELLTENEDNIDWSNLSGNPNAIELLKENQDKIDWYVLSGNPNAIELLRENQGKIYWPNLSSNPNIFKIKYNYNKMKQKRNETGISNEIKYKPPTRYQNESNENYNKRFKIWAHNLSEIEKINFTGNFVKLNKI